MLDQVRGKIRLKHYSIRTEQAYTDWFKRYILHLSYLAFPLLPFACFYSHSIVAGGLPEIS
jgi:hypothetical protein